MAVVKILACENKDRAELGSEMIYQWGGEMTKHENISGTNNVIKTFRALLKRF